VKNAVDVLFWVLAGEQLCATLGIFSALTLRPLRLCGEKAGKRLHRRGAEDAELTQRHC